MVQATLQLNVNGRKLLSSTREFATPLAAFQHLVEAEKFAAGLVPGMEEQSDSIITIVIDTRQRQQPRSEPCDHPECKAFRDSLRATLQPRTRPAEMDDHDRPHPTHDEGGEG